MLHIEKLNSEDLSQIRKLPKVSSVVVLLALAICVPLSFILGLTGLSKKGSGYWVTTILCLIPLLISLLYFLPKDYFNYKKDLSRQLKYTGTITVTSKSIKKDETIIFTNSNLIKKINIYLPQTFSEIQVGDSLFIEIARYSKTILRLEKNGKVLISDG